IESFSPGCSGLGSPDRGLQYVVTTRTPPLGSRERRSEPANASNMSISASPLTIGKPHSVILHQLPGLGIRLRGLQVTQGEFIDSSLCFTRISASPSMAPMRPCHPPISRLVSGSVTPGLTTTLSPMVQFLLFICSSHIQTCSYPSIILGGIRLAHTPLPHFFAESFVSSLTQPPVSLNVTTSLKSCSASSISCKVICCCVPRFHAGLSSVPSTR